jgi:hypothetical protein
MTLPVVTNDPSDTIRGTKESSGLGLGEEQGVRVATYKDTTDKEEVQMDGEDDRRIRLVGYSGLMLPVMEDVILAERAAQQPPSFSLRDLLTFSSVCGVDLDTVPVPGDVTPGQVAAVYTETATLAFRLDKPLSCRLLLMKGKCAGELTDTNSPYLCNTRVFQIS